MGLIGFPAGRESVEKARGATRWAYWAIVLAALLLARTGEASGANDRPVARGHAVAGTRFKDCRECPEMIVIPAGNFAMGSPAFETGRERAEGPRHRVAIPRFALGRTEVTQGQWRAIMGHNPSHFAQCGDDCPVENVDWNDAQAFIGKLNAKTGKSYRLPSEAEWEYACRGGRTNTRYCGGNRIDRVGWHQGNSGGRSHRVGGKQANGFGLHDMTGNVWEWVADCDHDRYDGAPNDGRAWTSGLCADRMLRGGSWDSVAPGARAATRIWDYPANRDNTGGFRVARTLP